MRRAKFVIGAFLVLVLFVTVAWGQGLTSYDLFKIKQVREVVLSPDGRYVAYTLSVPRPFSDPPGSYYRELWIYDLKTDRNRGYIVGKKSVYSLAWTPDSRQVTFRGNLGDVKGTQVYAIYVDGGAPVPLTECKTGILQYAISPDGKKLAFVTAKSKRAERQKWIKKGFNAEIYQEEAGDRLLYVKDLVSGKVEQITSEGSVFDFVWAPDSRRIAAAIAPRNTTDDSYMFKRIHLVDVVEKSVRKLVENPGKLGQMAWSPDGRYLAFVAGVDIHDPVAGSLFLVDTRNPVSFDKLQNVTSGFLGSVTSVVWKDAKTLLFSSDEGVYTTIRRYRLGDKSHKLVLEPGKVVFSHLSLAGNRIAFAADTKEHPAEVYVFDLKKKRLERKTSWNPWLADKKLGRQERVVYKARDGLEIEGVLIYPLDYQEGKRYPLITYVHGGPEACVKDGWQTSYSRWGQVAAAKGYFVFMPNYRASSGRGVEFAKMDHKDLMGAEFNDILDGIDYLINQGMVARDRVGIGGGSYGGYSSAWGATKHSSYFAAAVVFVGIADQVPKVYESDIPFELYYVHWTIWPQDDPMLFYDRSPVKYASNCKTPTLILHGKADPRVNPSQSLELYNALKIHGHAPVRLVYYPGEGHGNRRVAAQLDFNLRTLRWFDHYLKGMGPKDELPPLYIEYEIEE